MGERSQADLIAAYDAGFEASGEGWNGEYPAGVMEDAMYKMHRAQWVSNFILDAPAFAAARPSGGQWRPIETAPKDGTWVWAEWPEIPYDTKTKRKAPRIVAPAFYGRPEPQEKYMPHWCMNGRWTPGDSPARWFPITQPPASCDVQPKAEDPVGAESRSDASAVGRQSETPEPSSTEGEEMRAEIAHLRERVEKLEEALKDLREPAVARAGNPDAWAYQWEGQPICFAVAAAIRDLPLTTDVALSSSEAETRDAGH